MRRTLNHRGFTLVEVLIVLGILMCLVGILLPAISRAREQGRQVLCVNNLRQLTNAWLTYAADNDRFICSARTEAPVSGAPTWIGTVTLGGKKRLEAGALWRYLNDDAAYRCPDDATSNPSSYQINGVLAGTVGIPFPVRKLDELNNAAKTFVFIEGCRNNNRGTPIPSSVLEDAFNTPIYPQFTFKLLGFPGENHQGSSAAAAGTGISFADGHAMFWRYVDSRTSTIQEDLFSGLVTKDAAPNSPDVYQLEAWSGGQVPPNTTQ